MQTDIDAYNRAQDPDKKEICTVLAKEITGTLPKADQKIWHGSPVWFLKGNPIVGYSALKNGVQLLFWSGQSFDEPGLVPEGKFKAAEIRYSSVGDIHIPDLQRWLKKSETIQWDYKNIVKKRGVLERLQ